MSDYNPKDWDYDLLQRGIESLKLDAFQNRQWGNQAPDPDDKRDYYAAALALEHAVEFIEMNIKEGGILSPTETYFLEK